MKENNKDKLKSFIDDNKDDFDIFEPPSFEFKPSKKIEVEVNVPSSKKGIMIPLRNVMKVAAILAVIIGASYFWMYDTLKNENNVAVHSVQQKNQVEIIEPDVEFQLASVSDEMAELEGYYIQQVSLKLGELQDLGVAAEMEEELSVLDAEFSALKLELGDDLDNTVVINEMIKNYKLKLDLLQKVLDNIEESSTKSTVEKTKHNDEKYTVYY
jgi:uncharacterized protein YwgA